MPQFWPHWGLSACYNGGQSRWVRTDIIGVRGKQQVVSKEIKSPAGFGTGLNFGCFMVFWKTAKSDFIVCYELSIFRWLTIIGETFLEFFAGEEYAAFDSAEG